MRNEELEAAIFRRVAGKSEAINRLGITPKSTPDELNEIIKARAEAKAEAEGTKWEDLVKGQRWYIEDLQTYSGLNLEERKAVEHKSLFPDIASEQEMDDALEAIIAKQA